MIDAHCHILPNVDDGSKSIQQSIEMLQTAKNCGIDKIVFTSHTKDGFSDLGAQFQAYQAVKPHATQLGIQTEFGSEVNWRKLPEINPADWHKHCLGKSDLFLLEFSLNHVPSSWENIVYELQGQGFRVVIAHPERYTTVQENPDLVEDFKDMGCYTMMSANFVDKNFLGRFGKKIKKTGKKLLKNGLVDIVASDAHRPSSYDNFLEGIKVAQKYGYDPASADELLEDIF